MTIKKGVVIAGIALAAITAACILVYQMLTSGRVEPMGLLLLAAVIAVMLPMVRTRYFPSLADCRAELDFHAQRQAVFVRQLLADRLGPEPAQRIETATGAEEITALMARAAQREDADLIFALQIIWSNHHERAGDPKATAASLTEALRYRPHDFVVRFRLARSLEWQADPSGALAIYRGILADTAGLSRAMIKLTRRQMETLEGR
ncbi:MAG: hypothetical protein QNI97_00865 [Desulfobacterales bacterium]|nr:hypothetical protein [Desulfobacterales bacterium]MDJ0853585.1 hypothetical protein [Desulfobacterales bacterium]